MATSQLVTPHDDVLARLTDIAYQAVLKRGLRQSFVDVELELWNDIRNSFQPTDPSPWAEAVVNV